MDAQNLDEALRVHLEQMTLNLWNPEAAVSNAVTDVSDPEITLDSMLDAIQEMRQYIQTEHLATFFGRPDVQVLASETVVDEEGQPLEMLFDLGGIILGHPESLEVLGIKPTPRDQIDWVRFSESWNKLLSIRRDYG